MEGAGAAQLVSVVGQLVGGEYRELRGVGGQVAELSDELATMNAILRMHSDAEEGSADHFIREWVRQVSELAYDAEDCVHLYIFRIRCRPRDRFLVWSKRMLATLFPRRRLARQIKALQARAVAISERHARYGISRPPPSSARVPVVATYAHALRRGDDPHQFVGIKEQAETLARKLKVVSDNEFDTEQLQVFSIVGFGGLGKTTLAMEMCRQLEADFQRQAQVSVSQTFDGGKDLKALLKRILQQIVRPKIATKEDIKAKVEDPLSGIETMDLLDLADKLKDLLKNTRYLIVIDDVWTIPAWESIHFRLPRNKCGSRIIVTTRIETVAKACSRASVYDNYIYQIKALESTDAKKLFLSRAFRSRNKLCPKNLEEPMDKILKKCGGLPLAIVNMASLLANYDSPEKWGTVCNSIGSMMDNDPTLEGMRQILTLSYNDLPHYLKDCIMYLGIFPEDSLFSKTRLLRRWIAEGLVIARRGQTMMEVAEDYFDELVSRNMIEMVAYVITFMDRVETCRVHDMMLEVIVSKSLEANFVSLLGGQYEGMSYDKIRRLSVHAGEGGIAKVGETLSKGKAVRHSRRNNVVEEMNVQHVRSLSMFELEGHKVLDRLGEFTLLRVLDMEDCKGVANRHMKDICRMYLLTFLSLKGTDISLMPSELGDLEHLLTLDLLQTCLDDLPETVIKLEKLECLKFDNKGAWYVMWKLPRGLSNMKALREVERVLVGDVEIAKELGELEQLQRIFVHVIDNSQQEDVRQQLALSLSKMYSLRWLNLGDMKADGMTLDYLIHLKSPPPLLRHLRLSGGFTKLPEWVGSLTYLLEFTLSWAQLKDGQLLDVLCKLPSLKLIIFQHLFHVGAKLVVCTKHKFPALKEMMVLADCPRQYPEVLQFEEGSMTVLEKLTVNFSDWECKRIVGIKNLEKLKEVKLIGNERNTALKRALEEIEEESNSRSDSSRFKVTVTYE